MRATLGVLRRGTVSPDGMSIVIGRRKYPLAKGYGPRPPNTEEHVWIGPERRWLFLNIQAAVPLGKISRTAVDR